MAKRSVKKRAGVALEGDNTGPLGTTKSPLALPEGGQDGEKHKGRPKGGTPGGNIVTRGKGRGGR